MARSGPARRPKLAIVREGNAARHRADRFEGGLALEARAPAEPDWQQWWPTVRVPTAKQLQRRHPLTQIEGQLTHIEDDGKRRHLARLRQSWLVARDRDVAKRAQEDNRRCREAARSEWRRVVPVLELHGLATRIDFATFTDYCRTWARIDQCERDISERGLWVYGERGAVKNPATTVVNQLRTQLRFYVGELGLSPVARDAMNPRSGPDDEEDVFD